MKASIELLTEKAQKVRGYAAESIRRAEEAEENAKHFRESAADRIQCALAYEDAVKMLEGISCAA